MIKNLKSVSDFEFASERNSLIMKLIGLYPYSSTLNIKNFMIIKTQNIICYFCMFFVLVPCFLHVLIKEQNSYIKLKMVAPLCFSVVGVAKYSMILYRRKEILSCLKNVTEDWQCISNETFRNIMLKNSRVGRSLALLSILCMYGGGFSYRMINPLLATRHVNSQNVTIRPLSYPSYFIFFDVQKSPAYEVVFSLQIFSGFIVYSASICCCTLAAFLVMHAAGQLEILIHLLYELPQKSTEYNSSRKIALLVQHHLRIIR